VHGFPVRDTTGKIWRLVGTAQEITEQKRAVRSRQSLTDNPKSYEELIQSCILAVSEDLPEYDKGKVN